MNNNVPYITNKWDCSCGKENALRFQECSCCGEKMPIGIKTQIYWEEMAIQKAYFREEARKKSRQRLQRMDERMRNYVKVVKWISVVPLAVCAILLFVHKSDVRPLGLENRLNKLVYVISEAGPEHVEEIHTVVHSLKYGWDKVESGYNVFMHINEKRIIGLEDILEQRINEIQEKKEKAEQDVYFKFNSIYNIYR